MNTRSPLIIESLLQDGYRYALSLSHNPAKAEDLLQDAWVAVLQAKGPHEKAYLFSAIRSRFLNQHKRELLVPIVSIDEEQIGGVEQVMGLADVSIDDNDLEKSLATLRPVEREALYLSAVEGYTANEIAINTERSRGTVLSLIHRAKKKLQQFLDEELREVKS